MSRTFPRPPPRGFTLLEILLALALTGLLLVALNTFVFSMGELWGQRSDMRLFERHVRAVSRFLEQELRAASLPQAALPPDTAAVSPREIRTRGGASGPLLSFELPAGSRLCDWPGRPLPDVVCALQARPGEGLFLLWHSRLEKNFDTDAPRETVVSPLVTSLAYDYFDPETNRWTTESTLKSDPRGQSLPPQRLRLKFSYLQLTRESLIPLPAPGSLLPAY